MCRPFELCIHLQASPQCSDARGCHAVGASAPGSVFLNMQITATCLRFLKTLPKDGRLENEMVSACPDDPRQVVCNWTCHRESSGGSVRKCGDATSSQPVTQAMEEDGWRVRSISTHRSIVAEMLPDTMPQSVLPQLGSLREDGMLLYITATPVPGALAAARQS